MLLETGVVQSQMRKPAYLPSGILYNVCNLFCPQGFRLMYYNFTTEARGTFVLIDNPSINNEHSAFELYGESGVIMASNLMATFPIADPKKVQKKFGVKIDAYAPYNGNFLVYVTGETINFDEIVNGEFDEKSKLKIAGGGCFTYEKSIFSEENSFTIIDDCYAYRFEVKNNMICTDYYALPAYNPTFTSNYLNFLSNGSVIAFDGYGYIMLNSKLAVQGRVDQFGNHVLNDKVNGIVYYYQLYNRKLTVL